MSRLPRRSILVAALLALASGCEPPSAPSAFNSEKPASESSELVTAGSPSTRSPSTRSRAPTVTAPTTAAPRTSRLPSTRGTRDITFDDLKFDLSKGAPFERRLLSPAIEGLGDQRVRIRGYILPSFQQTGIQQFVLVRDNMECCFGPGAALYDCIVVEMLAGRTADYTVRPVAVTGTFSIREWRDEYSGKHLAIYKVDGDDVRQ